MNGCDHYNCNSIMNVKRMQNHHINGLDLGPRAILSHCLYHSVRLTEFVTLLSAASVAAAPSRAHSPGALGHWPRHRHKSLSWSELLLLNCNPSQRRSKRRSCCAATAPLRELALRSAPVGLPLEKSPSRTTASGPVCAYYRVK